MIEIADVCPTPREARPLTRGWGSAHWVCIFPTYAFLIGFVTFGILAVSLAGDSLPSGLFGGLLLGSWLVWTLGLHWQRRSYAAEARKAAAWRGVGASIGLACGSIMVSSRIASTGEPSKRCVTRKTGSCFSCRRPTIPSCPSGCWTSNSCLIFAN